MLAALGPASKFFTDGAAGYMLADAFKPYGACCQSNAFLRISSGNAYTRQIWRASAPVAACGVHAKSFCESCCQGGLQPLEQSPLRYMLALAPHARFGAYERGTAHLGFTAGTYSCRGQNGAVANLLNSQLKKGQHQPCVKKFRLT